MSAYLDCEFYDLRGGDLLREALGTVNHPEALPNLETDASAVEGAYF